MPSSWFCFKSILKNGLFSILFAWLICLQLYSLYFIFNLKRTLSLNVIKRGQTQRKLPSAIQNLSHSINVVFKSLKSGQSSAGANKSFFMEINKKEMTVICCFFSAVYNKVRFRYDVQDKRFLTVSPGPPTPPRGPSIPMSPWRQEEMSGFNKTLHLMELFHEACRRTKELKTT